MGFPALGDQVTLDHAGLHRVGTDVVGLGIGIDGFLARVLVEEDHGNILAAGLVDDRGAGCGVHQVDGQRLHATGQQDVDLVVLHRLVVLRIVHQQRNVFLLLGDALQRLAHGGHEVVVVFVNGDAHAIGCLGGGSEGGGRQHDSQDSLLHYRDLQFEIARASPIRKKNGPDPEDLLNKPHAARQISAQIRENPIGKTLTVPSAALSTGIHPSRRPEHAGYSPPPARKTDGATGPDTLLRPVRKILRDRMISCRSYSFFHLCGGASIPSTMGM